MTRLIPLLALLMASSVASADGHLPAGITQADLETVQQLQTRALESELAWELLESLTTEVGPRKAGTEGDEKAVAWAEAKFAELGFDRVWKEPVTFPFWRRGGIAVSMTAPFQHQFAGIALGGSPGPPEAGIEAEVVHFETYADLEQAEPAAVADKIVFISNRMERHRDGSGYGRAVVARSMGSATAFDKGAAAIVIRSIGTDNNRIPHTGMMRIPTDDEGNFLFDELVPAAAISNPDADLLVRALERGQPVTLKLVLDAGMDGEASSFNVIAEMTGSESPEELIILGSHLDSWDPAPGAFDDAAGQAITTAAAKLISELPERPRRTLRVIYYANEEQGLWGARQYAEAHRDELDRHIIGAESDFGADRVWRLKATVSDQSRPVIETIAEALAPLDIQYDAEGRAFGGADVGQLRAAGMPVVDLNQDGTRYFDLHHTANDTLDKVDPDQLKQNVAAWVTFAWLAAQAETDFRPLPE